MRSITNRILLSLLTLAASGSAFAQPDISQIPEPGVLALAGIGAAVAIAVSIARKRRK